MTKFRRLSITGLVTLSLAFLLLSACTTVSKGMSTSSSRPTHQSLYYFTVGSYTLNQGNFSLAGNLLEKASQFDTASPVIRKYILLNDVYSYYNDLISKREFERKMKNSDQSLLHDEQILLALYSVSAVKKDTLQIDRYLTALEREHPSSSVYLWRFYYSHSYRQQLDLNALKKAEELATAEPENLLQLARIYSLLDPNKAIKLLDQVLELQPSPEASSMRTALMMSMKEEEPVNQLFDGYVYPHDRDAMIDFLETALEQGDSAPILRNAEAILKSGDSALLGPLATVAFSTNDKDMMLRIGSVMDTKSGSTPEDSRLYAVLISGAIVRDETKDLTAYTSRLWTLDDVQTILGYTASFFGDREGLKFEELTPPIFEKCAQRFARVTSDSLMVSFMQIYTQMQYAAINTNEFVRLSVKLSRQILERGYGAEKDYLIVTQDLQINGDKDEMLILLEKAVDLFPTNAAFLNSLGYSLISDPLRLEEGGSLIRRAVELAPNEPFYMDSLAWYHYLRGEYDQALANMMLPMQLEEIPSEISYHIAMIFKALGQFPAARSFFMRAVSTADGSEYILKSQAELEQLP